MNKNNRQKLMEWASTIPMEELYSEIRRVTKISNLKFTSKIDERMGADGNMLIRILFSSQELTDQIGFLNLLISQLNIANGTSVIKYKKIDENIYPIYYGEVFLKCSIHGGIGRNTHTCELFSFKYDDRTGWTFN